MSALKLERIKRQFEILLAGIFAAAACCLVFLAALIFADIDATGGLTPVQPHDRVGFIIAMLVVVDALMIIVGVVGIMESPREDEDGNSWDDTVQGCGATLEVAIGNDDFVSDASR